MKKLNLFVILLTITTLVACSSQKKNEPEQKKQADAVQTETKKVETKTEKINLNNQYVMDKIKVKPIA